MKDCEKTLWIAYETDRTIENRNKLIEYYLPICERAAKAYGAKTKSQWEEWLGVAVVGLISCIERFDRSQRLRFETFASSRVKGSILDAVRALDWVPRAERAKQNKGEAVNIPAVTGEVVSYSRPVPRIRCEPAPPPPRTEWFEGLTDCSVQERTCVVLYYAKGKTMKEIGEKLGLSESRISQMFDHYRKRQRKRGREKLINELT